jgi:hypothetical protein
VPERKIGDRKISDAIFLSPIFLSGVFCPTAETTIKANPKPDQRAARLPMQ